MQSFVLILLTTNLILVSDQTCLEPFELLDFNQTHYGIKTDLKKIDNSFYLTNRCAVDTPRSNRKGNNLSKFTKVLLAIGSHIFSECKSNVV